MNETPIKTGADVYLTAERVVVHGDLFAFWSGHALQLAVHYVTPFRSVDVKQDENGEWPHEFHAIFDTQAAYDAGMASHTLDMRLANVMIVSPDFTLISNDVAQGMEGFKEEIARRDFQQMLGEALAHLISKDQPEGGTLQ